MATAWCTASPIGRESLHAVFEKARAAAAGSDAIVFEGRRWSYAETGAAADALAAGLAAQGIAAGDRVLMLMGNRPEFVFVLLALLRLGAIAVPVGVREQRPGLAYIARQCGAAAIVFDDALADRIPDANDAPALRWRFAASALSESASASTAAPPAGPNSRETDVAVILYTSGTTGNPKGAMLTHLAIVHSLLHFEACMGLRRGDRSALAVPASHVTGLIAIIASMWQVAGAVVVMPEFKADAFVRADGAGARQPHADGSGDVPAVPAERRDVASPT